MVCPHCKICTHGKKNCEIQRCGHELNGCWGM